MPWGRDRDEGLSQRQGLEGGASAWHPEWRGLESLELEIPNIPTFLGAWMLVGVPPRQVWARV